MGSSILTPEDARGFMREFGRGRIKIRVDLLTEDGEDFEYTNYDPILIDDSALSMIEFYYDNQDIMPSLKSIMRVIMGDVGSDSSSDENIVEELMGTIEEDLLLRGTEDDEIDDMIELLNELSRDLYNYISFALVNTDVVSSDKIWEFLYCEEAYMEHGKLYMTCRMYVEALKDLDFMDERTDIDFVEVVDEIRKLLEGTERLQQRKRSHSGYRDAGLVDELVA